MISNYNNIEKESPQKTNKQNKQLNTCLDNPNSSIITTKTNRTTTTTINTKTTSPKMSSLTADLRAAAAKAATASKTSTVKPPMEAVVINSIIYSKPSFCGIVVDLGGSLVGEVPATKEKMTNNNSYPNKMCGNEIIPCPMGIKPSPLGFASACLARLASPCPSSTAAQQDAQVYRMCTTMNGSIHHQISDLCDNLLAMANYFNAGTDDHDDDSFIEFAYNDGDFDDDHVDDDDDEEEDDEEDDEEDEDETDDEDDIEVEYDDYLDADKETVDLSYESSTINASKLNCDQKKKVRFNAKPIVHVMRTWSYAYRAARKGQWEMFARDRERFRLRIQRAAALLNPILEREHRQKIYDKRFANQFDNEDDDNGDDGHHYESQQIQIKQQLKKEVELKSALEAENFEKKKTSNTESKNSYQKKRRKRKRRYCRMAIKNYL